MNFNEAISIIEQRGDFHEYARLKKVFEGRLAELKENDHTERGLCYYYLLQSLLKAHLVYDTEECRDMFEKMRDEFKARDKEQSKNPKNYTKSEIKDFYRLMERCYSSLEINYARKGFNESKRHAYIEKMYYRERSYWFSGHYGEWAAYRFLELSSMYGDSFARWGITVMLFALGMALLFFIIDLEVGEQFKTIPSESAHWFDYIYFSIVTFTTLGIGDYTPKLFITKALSSIEVVFGFLMLGMFLYLVQKKL
ncbi:hypothetical protein A2448_00875 [Candidatus Peregrinibacteria bacterium RIFOXYC2_FULL_41_22]|nr:MAG: hypothetical protein A2448_00875 [Candidatus Peregrinibacteria bacterium RIFOXYC2_FULL_41_22]